MVYLHTAAAWVQAVPQQVRMHAAVVAGPASTGSGVRPRVRRRRSRRQWDWRTADNIMRESATFGYIIQHSETNSVITSPVSLV